MNFTLIVLAPLLLSACGTGDNQIPDQDFGQKVLPALDTPCEGIAGLTGQAILAQRVNSDTTTLAYLTSSGAQTSKTNLQLDVTWPDAPVATCYPPYPPTGGVSAPARVAITGLTLRFQTADGQFSETVAAKAWLPVLQGRPQLPQLIAVTTKDRLHGTWQPPPELATATTVDFALSLTGAQPGPSSGNVGIGTAPPAELDAAIFRGTFAAALWPAR